MSRFVELEREQYPDDALNKFTSSLQFNLDNARAMMWLSQLAYETAHKGKVAKHPQCLAFNDARIRHQRSRNGFTAQQRLRRGRRSTRRDVRYLCWQRSGKDRRWLTDFDAMPSATDLHTGFQDAVGTVWPKVKTAIESRSTPEQALILYRAQSGWRTSDCCASRAARRIEHSADRCLYIRQPATGGTKFFRRLYAVLGDSTFRLIDGTDIVPTVPPPLSGGYRHVGHAIQCKTDGTFDAQRQIMAPNQNKPELIESAIQSALADSGAIANFQIFHHGLGPDCSPSF